MKAPTPPKTPDPYAVASAQQLANITVAVANTILANADEVTPQGTVSYEQIESIPVLEPKYDSNGNQVGITQHNIPRWKRTVALEAGAQILYDQQQTISENFNAFAISQTDALKTLFSSPLSLSSLPPRNATPTAPTLDEVLTDNRAFQRTVGAHDIEADRRRHEDAINERIQYQVELEREALRVKLRNQGLNPGSTAWTREMFAFDKRANDGFTQARIAAGQEQTRAFQIELQQGAFYNDVVEKEFQHGVLIIQHKNMTRVQTFQILRDLADYVNGIRSDTLKELVTERSATINELSALMHGGQVQIPQFQGFRPGHISETPLGEYVYRSAAMDMQKYQMAEQRQQQMMAGMMSLGANLAMAPMTGGGSLLGNMMGGLMR